MSGVLWTEKEDKLLRAFPSIDMRMSEFVETYLPGRTVAGAEYRLPIALHGGGRSTSGYQPGYDRPTGGHKPEKASAMLVAACDEIGGTWDADAQRAWIKRHGVAA
ncbi:hypothetical protein [Stakelama pacifica]|uniref:Uncharacterized protein n=1 Tax=Stakelama pacifica TaxID=517720 RepID=A0A4R6FM97_9SPHN|nr:hypothetical protein [Stakelama pacifica]TDN81755.1 hypothetical protein EV664_107157 [Stakelama pacifica]GGO96478.1 hypothetical protein GCM10011329_23100 [Stakelama pacifica]